MRIEPTGGINKIANVSEQIQQNNITKANVVKVQQHLNEQRLEQEKQPGNLDAENLIKEIEKKLEKIKIIFRGEAQFIYDQELNIIIVKIKDKETGEIIRQIPTEVAIRIAKNLQELIGMLFDERV
ncbi:flagellar protein FlaG [Pseudothermotoga thermarum]|uniref:Flagellar protein FlaG protein n=1 Tax=Pseudothermotoga thermarum DSM 5069 TaxID=688269 RepID=F7YV91_9THEM|nr:flagellar protein FlaG [Pseudothermotoga thermarum]AEH50391.1 flagellar protein FlaG protein [Pseudothermotoga thermarum DSM 5069]